MIKQQQQYLTLKESAEYLGIGLSTAKDKKKGWTSWLKYGVVPSRYPKRTLRFNKSDLDKLMDALKVA